MKVDSAILSRALCSSCEMSKLRFRLNSVCQSCQNRMFTPCRYFSRHRQLTGVQYTGCEAILIWSQALLLFFPLHHLMCSSCGQICKHHQFLPLSLLCPSPFSLSLSLFLALSVGSYGHTHVEQCPRQTWPQAVRRRTNGLPWHQSSQIPRDLPQGPNIESKQRGPSQFLEPVRCGFLQWPGNEDK